MAPGGTLFRFTPHFGENVLPHGSHEWLPYNKDEVRLKTVNNIFPFFPFPINSPRCEANGSPRHSPEAHWVSPESWAAPEAGGD